MRRAAYGDTILLASTDRKQYVRTLTPGAEFGMHLGTVRHDDLVGLPYGSAIRTHLGNLLYLLIPQLTHLIKHARHETAIIQPKHLGDISLKLRVHPEVRDSQPGTRSGALTLLLASVVGD